MIKAPEGKYKYGRSSVKEGLLLKLKLFRDIELICVGYEPLYKNTNEAVTNELGRSSRSTSKDGLVAQELIGAVILDQGNGTLVNCGSGFSAEERKYWWEHREELIGKMITVKYFDVGVKDALRFPTFKGVRDVLDL